MPPSLYSKLNLKSGMQGLVMRPPDGFTSLLELPDDITLRKRVGKNYDFVIGFATMMKDARDLIPKMKRTLKHDGVFWLCYPKKTSGVPSNLSRDILWVELQKEDLDAVRMVSVDDTWSAMRFRPLDMVKKK